MDIIVGIDVSKDRLDVHVLPTGDTFFVGTDHAGVETLAVRLRRIKGVDVALRAAAGVVTATATANRAVRSERARRRVRRPVKVR